MEGDIIPAARSLDQPPDFNLLDAFLEYRRMRLQQQRLMRDDSDAEEDPDAGRHEKAAVAADRTQELLNKFDEEDELRTDAENDDGPLRARVYVGAQLVSFPIQDKGEKSPAS